jgi:branched-chain amino acid transport system ATP-binding protein
MGVVFDLATHVAVLHHGEMIATGSPAEVRENPLVRKIYLGSGGGHA